MDTNDPLENLNEATGSAFLPAVSSGGGGGESTTPSMSLRTLRWALI